jgi:hypothetical protein
MANLISGGSVRIQVGEEDTYGTVPTMERQIRIASEDFKYTPSKAQEGVLTGNIGAAPFQTMGIRTENSISILARPDDLGLFLKGCFGVEETPVTVDGVTTHVFTPIGNALTDSLTSYTFLVDKKTDIFVYNGCKINSLSFSTAPEDFLNLDVEMFGKDELYNGTFVTTISPSPLKAFVFNGGKVYLAGTEMADVTSISFSYSNNLENTIQTTSTGLYYVEPQANLRELNCDLEMLYSAAAEQWRKDWFKTDDILSVKLEFTSREKIVDNIPYKFTIEIAAAQVSECSNSVSDGNGIKQTATIVGIDNGVNDLIKATLINAFDSEY